MGLLLPVVFIAAFLAAATTAEVTSSGCGTTKACFRDPSDCTNAATCNFLLSFKENAGNSSFVDFEILGSVTGNGWVAVGFSNDKLMGDDSGVTCVKTDSASEVKTFFNTGQTSALGAATGITDPVVTVTDNMMHCSFTRAKSVDGNSQFFDLDTMYYLFMGSGPVAVGYPAQHATDPWVSTNKIDLSTTDDVLADEPHISASHEIDTGSHVSANVIVVVSLIGLLVALFM